MDLSGSKQMAACGHPSVTGLDLGRTDSHLHTLDQHGKLLRRESFDSSLNALAAIFTASEPHDVWLEAGATSLWVTHLLGELGFNVTVLPPNILKNSDRNRHKSDRRDAKELAEYGYDRRQSKMRGVYHRSENIQRDLWSIHMRENLVNMRTDCILRTRSYATALGGAIESCDTKKFVEVVKGTMDGPFQELVGPELALIEALNVQIMLADRHVRYLAREKYPETALMRQIPGVGDLIAVTYRLTIDRPSRFSSPKHIPSYLGLVPRQSQSGTRSFQARTRRVGNECLRRMLIMGARTIIHSERDSNLQRLGRRILERGGSGAARKAEMAVGRELVLCMHHHWVTGEVYHPRIDFDS